MSDQIPAEAVEAAWARLHEGRDETYFDAMRAALEAALPFLHPEPPVTHRPGDEIDGTVYCSCGDGDYGSEGHRPEPSEDERADLRDLIFHHEYIDGASGTMRDAEALRDAIFAAGFRRHPTPSREQVEAWVRNNFAMSNGTHVWVEFQGSVDEMTDAVLALLKGADRA